MYEIHAEERQVIGRTVKTWEREIIDACMLKAAAGTTGYQGGDTGMVAGRICDLVLILAVQICSCRLSTRTVERGLEIALGARQNCILCWEALEFDLMY